MIKYYKNGAIKSFGIPCVKKNGRKSRKQTEKNFKDVQGNIIALWYCTDKNGSICDCARLGNSLDRLHGRPATLVDPYEIMKEEYILNIKKG